MGWTNNETIRKGLTWLMEHETLLVKAMSVLTLAIVVLLSVGQCSKQDLFEKTLAEHADEAERFKAEAKRAISYSDSIEKVAASRNRRIVALETKIDKLLAQRPPQSSLDSQRVALDSMFESLSDSVKFAYRIIPTQHLLIVRQDSTIRLQDSIIVKQDKLLVLKDSTLLGVTASRDSLRKVLSVVPTPPKPYRILGFIPAPSRRTSFFLGLVGGTVLTARILQ